MTGCEAGLIVLTVRDSPKPPGKVFFDMTTEIAFHQSSSRSRIPAGDEAEALRALLRRKGANGGSGPVNAAVALLKRAHDMIVRAEDTIIGQDIRIAALQDIVTIDEVTGLYNRRGFFGAFSRELALCERGLSMGGLLVSVEIDNHKVMGESHGTMAADACMRLAARALESDIRAMDAAARTGADEFALMLSNTTKKDAAGRVQDIGWRLNNLSLAWYGDVIPVRAGMSLRPYGKGDRIEGFFSDAVPPRLRKSGLATQQQ